MAANPDDLFPITIDDGATIGVKPPVTPPTEALLPTQPEWQAPFSTTAPKVDPVKSVLDKPTETVQGQLQGLFQEGNPLMVQARNDATAAAAGRGLQNSTLAAGAGEQAMIRSALPIAQQDATTYANRNLFNTQTSNDFLKNEQLFGQQLAAIGAQGNVSSKLGWESSFQRQQEILTEGKINWALSEQDFQNKMGMSKEEFRQKLILTEEDHLNRLTEMRTSGDIEAYLAELNAGFTMDIKTLEGDIARQQSLIDHGNRLVEMAAQGDIESQLMLQKYGFDSSLSAQENVQRLSELAMQGDINAKLQLQQFNYDTLLADQANGFALTLEDKRIQANQNLLLIEYQQRGVLSEQEAQQELVRLNQQHSNTLEQIATQIAAQAEATGATDAANASRAIQSQYLTAVASRQTAASEEIARIYQTEGLTSAQQNTAVQNAYSRMNSDLNMLAAYYSTLPVWPTGASTTPIYSSGPATGVVPNTQTPAPIAGGGTTYPNTTYPNTTQPTRTMPAYNLYGEPNEPIYGSSYTYTP